ncbi:MAG: carbohydrate ABC transporter permease [Caldilineaceae bacterium]|nr:carbohydrate ABC transporter permease [Caldilineaceae bacterium]
MATVIEQRQPVHRAQPARRGVRWERVALQMLLIIGSLVMAYPLLFGLAASISTLEAYAQSSWFPMPNSLYLENYIVLFTSQSDIPLWVLNTVLRIAWYVVVPGAVAVLAGYVFARLRFWGRDAVFILLLSSMMVPGIVYYVPTYVMMARWPLADGNDLLGQGGHGFINAWPAMLIPGMVNVFYVFLLRQTFYSIPKDFEEAARVDGANTLQVLLRVYLPMLKPAITVMVIFQFVAIWNDYLWPLVVAGGNQDIWPVALGFQRIMFSGASFKGARAGVITDYPFAFTLATVATFPTVLIFLFLQRYFVEGVQGFALKG